MLECVCGHGARDGSLNQRQFRGKSLLTNGVGVIRGLKLRPGGAAPWQTSLSTHVVLTSRRAAHSDRRIPHFLASSSKHSSLLELPNSSICFVLPPVETPVSSTRPMLSADGHTLLSYHYHGRTATTLRQMRLSEIPEDNEGSHPSNTVPDPKRTPDLSGLVVVGRRRTAEKTLVRSQLGHETPSGAEPSTTPSFTALSTCLTTSIVQSPSETFPRQNQAKRTKVCDDPCFWQR